MKDFKVLLLLDKFTCLFEKTGIDYEIMRKLLQIRLLMDRRRKPTAIGNSMNGRKGKKEGNYYFRSLLIYGCLSLITVPLVLMDTNYLIQMGVIFGIVLFMVMTSLISDFSSVLLDLNDKAILFSKPVNAKTVNMAKVIHIFIYMAMLTGVLSVPALIAGLIRHGILFFLIFFTAIVMMDFLIISLTALIYLLVLKFFDGEKLKDIINYVQIILSIAVAVSYQFVGHLSQLMHINTTLSPKLWEYFIIPLWFAAPFEWVFHGKTDPFYIISSMMAIFIPVLCIVLYIKKIPSFENYLQKLDNNDSKRKIKTNKLSERIAGAICSSDEEKIFYKFSSVMIRKERDFKLKVYPALGLSLVLPFILMFNSLSDSGFDKLQTGKSYILIYFSALLIPSVIMMLKFSGSYKGGWIYKTVPVGKAGSIFKGTIKAVIVQLLIPLYTFECIIFLAIFGVRIVPDLILVLINILLFVVINFRSHQKTLPFTRSFDMMGRTESSAVFLQLFIVLIIAGVHLACTFINYGIYLNMFVSLVLNIVLWKKSFELSLESVQ